MPLSRRIAAAASAFALALTLPAQPVRAQASDVGRATLANGLQIVVVRDALAPVVTEIVTYKAGTDQGPPGFPETAHAVEHMTAGRSLTGLSADQAADIWTLLGSDADAETTELRTSYYFTVPREFLNVALNVEAARMRGPLFIPSEWTDERPAIRNEIEGQLSNSGRRTIVKALNALYPGQFDDSIRIPGLEKTTAAQLKAFFEKWYAPNNALLVVTGDVDPAATIADARAIFGSIPRRAVGVKSTPSFGPVKATTISDVSDLPVPLAFYAWRMPGASDPSYPVAQIAGDVLSSQRGAIAALGYEGKALFAAFEYSPAGEGGVGIGIVASAPGSDPKASLPLIASAIDAMRANGVPADLVEAAKRREIASALYRRNSISGLAFEWTSALTEAKADSPDAVVDRLRGVSVDDVNAFLKTHLLTSDAITGVLTPKPGAKGGSGGTGAIKDSFAPKNPKAVALPKWAAVLSRPAQAPPPRPLPYDVTLANGIRLIVQSTAISPTVTLRGRIRTNSDLQAPAGQEGVDDILGGLFAYGTATLDRVAFQKALDDVAVDVSAGSSFSAQAPKEQFDRALDLLADNLLHPALPAQAFAIVQKQTAQGLAGELTSPDYLAERALQSALLPKGDPSLREATPASVNSLTIDDVKAYAAKTYRPDLTTIVIVGDISPQAARASVERAFGAWTATGPAPDLELKPVPPNKPAAAHITAAGRRQDTVALSETLAINRKNPDYYALTLGDSVLGGGFYSTRLYRDLRKDTGLVYYVSANVDAGRSRSTYDASYASAPKNTARARSILDRDLRAMSTTLATPSELQTAKNQILRSMPLRLASIDGIAGAYLSRAGYDLPLNEDEHEANVILSTSAVQVRDAFKRHVDPSRFVQVTTGPAGK